MADVPDMTTAQSPLLDINTPLDDLAGYVPGKGFGFTTATFLSLRNKEKSAWLSPNAASSVLHAFLIYWKIRSQRYRARSLQPRAEDIFRVLRAMHNGQEVFLDIFGQYAASALRDDTATALDVVVLVLLDIKRDVVRETEREKKLSTIDVSDLQPGDVPQYRVSTIEWVRDTISSKIAPELRGLRSFAESLLESYEFPSRPAVQVSDSTRPAVPVDGTARPAVQANGLEDERSKEQIQALGILYSQIMPDPVLTTLPTVEAIRDNFIKWESGAGADIIDIHAELVGQMGFCMEVGDVEGYNKRSGKLFAAEVRRLFPERTILAQRLLSSQ